MFISQLSNFLFMVGLVSLESRSDRLFLVEKSSSNQIGDNK